MYLSHNQSNPTSVIFNFHGFGSNAFEQMNYGDFRDLADENAFIIAHPQGTTTYGNGPHWNNWNGDGGTSNQDDIGFIDELISSCRHFIILMTKGLFNWHV